MIQITVNKDGTVSNNRIIIGNKYENNDEMLKNLKDDFLMVIFVIWMEK